MQWLRSVFGVSRLRGIKPVIQADGAGGFGKEELAIFDLLTKPESKLAKAQKVEVKKRARALLAKLKREKLVLDWRLTEPAKADVRETIRVELDALPEVCDRRIWGEKGARTFQFVYERYPGAVSARV